MCGGSVGSSERRAARFLFLSIGQSHHTAVAAESRSATPTHRHGLNIKKSVTNTDNKLTVKTDMGQILS